jgi:hypothetical protein
MSTVSLFESVRVNAAHKTLAKSTQDSNSKQKANQMQNLSNDLRVFIAIL